MPKTSPPLRKLIFAILLLAVAAFAAVGPAVTEASSNNCLYYSDASHTTLVGKFGRDCCNNVYAWGVKTSFSSCSPACFVCFPPPPA